MALQKYAITNLRLFYPVLFQKVQNKFTNRLKYSEEKLEIDTLDNFTTELLQKKMAIWESKKANLDKARPSVQQSKKYRKSDKVKSLQQMNVTELNDYMISSIQEYNDDKVMEIIKYSVENNICLDQTIYLHTLNLCALKGEVELIQQIEQVLKTNQIILGSLFDITVFTARAVWVKGNIIKSIKMFEEIYEHKPFIRRQIKLVLKYLIKDAITNRSESILVNITKFSQLLVDKYDEYFFMICVWEVCFMSDWFTDQTIALELCEKNKKLCEKIVPGIAYIITTCINNGKTDVVYRLLEMFLRFEMTEQYPLALGALLDYHFKRGDLLNYMEVLKWSLVNEVNLPKIYSKRYLE